MLPKPSDSANRYTHSKASDGSRDLLPLLVIGGLSSLTIGVTKVLIPLQALALNANEFQLGLVTAALSLGMFLMSLPVGKLLSFINVKHSFGLGLVLSILIYIGLYFVESIWLFLIMTVVLSATFPFRFIALQKKFLILLKKVGPGASGWLRAVQMLSIFVFGPTLVGLYLGYGELQHLTWIIIAILIVCFVFNMTSSGLHLTPQPLKRNTASSPNLLCQAKQHTRLNSAYGIEMAVAAAMNIFNGFSVILVSSRYGLDASAAATLMVWQGFGFAMCLLFGGSIVAYLKQVHLLWGCLIMTFFALILLPQTEFIWQAKLLALVMGICMAMLTILNMGTFSDLSRDEESSRRIATLSVLMVPIGAAFGTALAGLIAHFLNISFVYYLAAFFVFLAAAYVVLLQKRFRLLEVNHV